MMQRRNFLHLMSLGMASPLLARAAPVSAEAALAQLDACALAALLRGGRLAPGELLDAAFGRIARLDPRLHAFVHLCEARARQQLQGPQGPHGATPFWGVPYAYKDAVDLAGTPRRAGSRASSAAGSEASAPYVLRCEASGLIALGKTSTPELLLSASTEPLLGGPTRNPWDLRRSVGGSSGGAAAAVASAMLPMAHASDGGGSIRIPASCAGLFGLKPSRARMQGSSPADSGVEHCLSWSVRDSATLFGWNQRQDAAAPLPPMDPVYGPAKRRLRIGLCMANLFGQAPDEAVRRAIEQTARLCETLGHRVQPFDHGIDGELFFKHFLLAWAGGAERALRAVEARGLPAQQLLEPWTLHLAAHARTQPPEARAAASDYFGRLARQLDACFERVDLLLSPVLASVPPPLGELAPTLPGALLQQRLLRYASYTPQHNVAGTPAMSVPLGHDGAGLPIGSQFAARVGDEQTLFELAYELEQAQPWERAPL